MKKDKITGKEYDLIQSFNHAFDGIFEAIRTENHMKFHGFITVVAAFVCIFTDVTKYEIITIALTVSSVWVAELLNSAIESIVDMITTEYHPLAKRAKDIGAGAVLITGLNAIVVGYLIFNRKFSFAVNNFFLRYKNSFQNTIVIILTFVVVLVIILKVIFKKGTPLKGGIPSGHSALGGAGFSAIVILTRDLRVFFL
ncbi:MAG: diacylglycerol kinase, partial [Fusobacteriaceae bacterium]